MFFFLDERRRVSAVEKSSPNIKSVQKILKRLCSFIAPYLEKSNEKMCDGDYTALYVSVTVICFLACVILANTSFSKKV